MENRIKEQQLCLFADRTSCSQMRANQFLLYFSSFAYVLMQALRRLGLKGTPFANAQCSTLRVKLLKIAARVDVSARAGCGFHGLKTIHGNVNSHELWSISNKCRYAHTCITPNSPSMTIMADGLDRSPGRGAAARCGKSWIWGLNRENGAHLPVATVLRHVRRLYQ